MEVPTDNPLTEEQARLYFRDIVLGIEYCELSSGNFCERQTNQKPHPVHRSVRNKELWEFRYTRRIIVVSPRNVFCVFTPHNFASTQ